MHDVRRPEVTTPLTDRRIHDLALQRWLQHSFILKQGYPVPIVFAHPMDAFSQFENLWKSENNPYSYLYSLRDVDGAPAYQPYPSPARYPIISVNRAGLGYRPSQSYGTRFFRAEYYRTAAKDVSLEDVGIAVNKNMPTAWDFRYQITHMCLRPDTQAIFEHNLVRSFEWTPDPAQEEQTIYTTSFTIVVEGYSVDLNEVLLPALWSKMLRVGTLPLPIDDINLLFEVDVPLKEDGQNTLVEIKDNMPSRDSDK